MVSHPFSQSAHVTAARARAQRAKLDTQARARHKAPSSSSPSSGRAASTASPKARAPMARRRAKTTLEEAIAEYLEDHEGGNHSPKTLAWHRTALGLLRSFLEEERETEYVSEVEAADLSAWFSYLRKTPGGHGKSRNERTVQTYARSARAFFHWLVRRGTLGHNPFEQVVFPKVGRPLIRLIEPEEFERLLIACAPPRETGPLADRAAARNRAILWLFYDTGIRLGELCQLRLGDFDRKHGLIIVKGKGNKERRLALGSNCLRHLLYYLDRHRPDQEELIAWGSPGEDHLFLSETRRPLSINGVTLLFARIKKRAGITDKRVSPHIFRHTFAMRYLAESHDLFSLKELLGHEDLSTVLYYLHLNDELLQQQKREFSPGDHLPVRMPGPREHRRQGFQTRQR